MVDKIGLDLPYTADDVGSGLATDVPTSIDASNQAMIGQMQARMPSFEPVEEPGPQVFYSPTSKEMFVNGSIFADDDAPAALESVRYLEARPVAPPSGDWVRVSPEDYGSYIRGIRNPQAGRLFSENIDIGGSNLKTLGGRALQFLGAEETGQSWVDSATEELRRNQPFQRSFTEIDEFYIADGEKGESNDAIDWFVANFAQQIPNLIESVIAGLVGIGVGTAAAPVGTLSTVGGAILKQTGRPNYKQAVITAANKYAKNKSRQAKDLPIKDPLSNGEKKLLREISSLTAVAYEKNPNVFMGLPLPKGAFRDNIIKANKARLDDAIDAGIDPVSQLVTRVGRQQSLTGGAATFLGLSSYGIGLGDIYGEQREQGQDDRLSAAFSAIPYAAFEVLPEFVLASRIFRVSPKRMNLDMVAHEKPNLLLRPGAETGGVGARGVKGFGVGAVLEGTTEAAQEALILANTGQLDIEDPQIRDRFYNAFAAGAAVGGPIGGVANILSKPSSDILDPSNTNTEPGSTADLISEDKDQNKNVLSPDEKFKKAVDSAIERNKLLDEQRKKREARNQQRRGKQLVLPGLPTAGGVATGTDTDALEDTSQFDATDIIAREREAAKVDAAATAAATADATAEMYADEELRSIPERSELVQKTYADEELRTDKNVLKEIDALNNVIRDVTADATVDVNADVDADVDAELKNQAKNAATLFNEEQTDVDADVDVDVPGTRKRGDPYPTVFPNLQPNLNYTLKSRGTDLRGKRKSIDNYVYTIPIANKNLVTKQNQGYMVETKDLTKVRDSILARMNTLRTKERTNDEGVREQVVPINELKANAVRNREYGILAEDLANVEAVLKDIRDKEAQGLSGIRQPKSRYRKGKAAAYNNMSLAQKRKWLEKRGTRILRRAGFTSQGGTKTDAEKEAERQAAAASIEAILKRGLTDLENQQKGGTQDAVQKQGPDAVVTEKQTRDSEEVSGRDDKETTSKPTREDATDIIAKERKGKGKSLKKKTKDTVREDSGERISKPEDKTLKSVGEATPTEITDKTKSLKKGKEEVEEARKEPIQKYDTPTNAWADIRQKIPGGKSLDYTNLPTEIQELLDVNNVENREINLVEIEELLNDLSFDSYKNYDQGMYAQTLIDKFEESKSDNQAKKDILEDMLKIGWFETYNSDLLGDTRPTESSVTKISNYLTDYFLRGFATPNEHTLAEELIISITTTTQKEGSIINEFTVKGRAKNLSIIDRRKDRTFKPWATYAMEHGIMPSIQKRREENGLSEIKIPEEWIPFLEGPSRKVLIGPETKNKDKDKDIILDDLTLADFEKDETYIYLDTLATNELRLSRIIDNLILDNPDQTAIKHNSSKSSVKVKMEKLYKEIKKTGNPNFIIERNGKQLSDYFSEKGFVRLRKDGNKYVPTTKTIKEVTEDTAKINKLKKDKDKGKPEGPTSVDLKNQKEIDLLSDDEIANLTSRIDDDDPTGGMNFRADGSIIRNPVNRIKAQAVVNRYLKGLKFKPTVTIVQNKTELKSKHPKLYKRAVESRKKYKDFDTTPAVGFSVGDQVILFLDNSKTEQQLEFVLAHEVMGHFGLKAFVPGNNLKKALDIAYKSDGHIQAVADKNMDNGIERYEAIEEALADAAATLDTNILKRIWYAIKSFFTKIRHQEDNFVRYWLHQARRNLRSSNGNHVSMKEFMSKMRSIEDDNEIGYFNAGQNTNSLPATIFSLLGLTTTSTDGVWNGMKKTASNFKEKAAEGDFQTTVGKLLEKLQTLGNRATRSEGLREVANGMGMQAKKVKNLERTYESLTKFSTKPNAFNSDSTKNTPLDKSEGMTALYNKLVEQGNAGFEAGEPGPTTQELQFAGDLAVYAAINKGRNITDATIRSKDTSLFIEQEDGTLNINYDMAKELEGMGLYTIEQFNDGIPYTLDISPDETKMWTPKTNPAGEFTITPRIYKIYLDIRKGNSKAAMDVLEASFESTKFEKLDIIQNFLANAGLDSSQPYPIIRQTLEAIMDKYRQLNQEGAKVEGVKLKLSEDSKLKADNFLREINRALWNKNKLNDWQTGKAGQNEQGQQLYNFTKETGFQRIIDGLEELHNLYAGNEFDSNEITNSIKRLSTLDERVRQAEFNAKRSLMTGYVQLARKGGKQIQIRAYDQKRNRIDMDQSYKNSMPYYQVDTAQDARDLDRQIREAFGDNKFNVLDMQGNEVSVTLEPEISDSRTTSPLANDITLHEWIRIADKMQINITDAERERIVLGLTNSGEAARKKLNRTGNPGWDRNIIQIQAQYMRSQAHLAGKTYFQYKLNNVLTQNRYWLGDDAKLKRKLETLKLVEDSPTSTPEQIHLARQSYDEYAQMYRYSSARNPNNKITVFTNTADGNTRKSKQVLGEGRGESYREQANEILAYYSDVDNIIDATDNILDDSSAGQYLKVLAVSSQLGGSVATGLINSMSMVTHSIPYLATYNPKTGFGGGFGITNASYEMQKAVRQMSDVVKQFRDKGSLADLDHMNAVAGYDPEARKFSTDKKFTDRAKQLQDRYNISPDEARVLRNATAEGVLQAAQYNSLVGTARGGLSNNVSDVLAKWMSLFSYTEQLNRRATFLAAYRLQRQRLQAATSDKSNKPLPLSEINEKKAAEFAEIAVNTSQGEYSMFNRPKISRGPLLNFIMMYKMFVMISVELVRNLGTREKIMFLTMLFLLAGLKGLPFSDDIMDLLDTLLQKSGVKMATIEKELNVFFNEVAPGTSPIIMRGLLDYYIGATVSTRLGFGDLVPLSGIGKAGADPWRESENFLGPVWSAWEQALTAMTMSANWIGGTIGVKPKTVRGIDIWRNQPFGGIRALADSYMYTMDGAVTSKEGKILDKNVSGLEIFLRAMNFYPATASYQNDIIRMNKQTTDYVKAYKIKFAEAYAKARISGDKDEVKRILKDVKQHNKENKGTEFYLEKFMESAQRKYKAWKLPAGERFKKFARERTRNDIQVLLEAYDID